MFLNCEDILICFAGRTESRFFRRRRLDVSVLHTGIGRRNAKAALEDCLARRRPELIITSGFAGGLNPELRLHELLFERSGEHPLFDGLAGFPFREGRFCCRDRIVVTAEEKRLLWRSGGCDAVEMESGGIHEIAQSRRIPCLTLRAISDASHENLPLDFNRLLTSRRNLDWAKLCGALCRNPGRLPALVRFCGSIAKTSRALAGALCRLLGGLACFVAMTTERLQNEFFGIMVCSL